MEIGNVLLNALREKYAGDVAVHKANIEVYLTNPAGIGEHPDVIDAINEQLELLAEADEKLEALNKYFGDR